ncbi:hypothetical protein [Vreelandella profundi]|uniref:hypothetical protein n=1 Tax=Vreelandella profundi TaxID=2852117 RepID=UPI001F2D3141|nr:hypothetical protein [Halomonas profundi]
MPPVALPVGDFGGVGFDGAGLADAALGDDAVLGAGEGELVAGVDELGAEAPGDVGATVALAAGETALLAPPLPRRRERWLLAPL